MTSMDNALLITWAIEYEGGSFAREAGQVLYDLAFLTGVNYKVVSRTLLEMEAIGAVTISRLSHPDPRRANKIIDIRITGGTPT
jgi:predicted transcriptional regulator